MNYQEYVTVKNNIMNSSDCTEVNVRPKLEDQYGYQYVLSKTDYVSSAGTLTQEFSYEGDTRNFTLQSILEYLTIDGVRTDEVKQEV